MSNLNMSMELFSGGYGYGGENQARKAAYGLYESLSTRRWLRRLWASVTHHTPHLMCLTEINETATVIGGHYAGVETVQLDRIRGSQGRCNDFDSAFTPLKNYNKERWLSVATAYQAGVALPLVSLIQVGEDYFVQDGHHRVSVARAFGQQQIEAEVTVMEVADTHAHFNDN